jgi:hypothetical protein
LSVHRDNDLGPGPANWSLPVQEWGISSVDVGDKRPPDADYVILANPEGNRFCVVDAG